MLLKNDKIKMIKSINGFDQIGQIFEVKEILENGMISFGCDFDTRLMSYGEFENHFEKVVERKGYLEKNRV